MKLGSLGHPLAAQEGAHALLIVLRTRRRQQVLAGESSEAGPAPHGLHY